MSKKILKKDPDFKIRQSTASISLTNQSGIAKRLRWTLKKNRWNQIQQQLYISFISQNKSKLLQPRKFKLYQMMSKHIKSRNANQCKSHHVKMIKKHYKLTLTLLQNLNQGQQQVKIEEMPYKDQIDSFKSNQQMKLSSPTQNFQYMKEQYAKQMQSNVIVKVEQDQNLYEY